jgi:uncharacterized membrane-anchored protein
MRKILLLAGLLPSLFGFAGEPTDTSAAAILEQMRMIDSIESKLHYKTGTVTLQNGIATVNIAPGFKFLDAEEARYVIEDVWGNLKGQTALGMIIPAGQKAAIADYAFIVEFEAMGYVKDDDADDINYDDLLKGMQEEAVKSNEERRKLGVATIDLLGWAENPYYDKQRKLLYWARKLKVEGAEENTLNYDIRVLGRKGVLVLQAVSGMSQLDSVKANKDKILNMVSFNKGSRYEDFDSNVDDVAAWTVGGLVAGKVLAKAGILAMILKNIKLVILGIAALGGGIWRFITGRRRKKEEETLYQQPEATQEVQP